jgi:hypothetical protein
MYDAAQCRWRVGVGRVVCGSLQPRLMLRPSCLASCRWSSAFHASAPACAFTMVKRYGGWDRTSCRWFAREVATVSPCHAPGRATNGNSLSIMLLIFSLRLHSGSASRRIYRQSLQRQCSTDNISGLDRLCLTRPERGEAEGYTYRLRPSLKMWCPRKGVAGSSPVPSASQVTVPNGVAGPFPFGLPQKKSPVLAAALQCPRPASLNLADQRHAQ